MATDLKWPSPRSYAFLRGLGLRQGKETRNELTGSGGGGGVSGSAAFDHLERKGGMRGGPLDLSPESRDSDPESRAVHQTEGWTRGINYSKWPLGRKTDRQRVGH